MIAEGFYFSFIGNKVCQWLPMANKGLYHWRPQNASNDVILKITTNETEEQIAVETVKLIKLIMETPPCKRDPKFASKI